MILDPDIKAFTEVKATLIFDTTPIDALDIDAELVVMVDTTEVTVTLPVSME